MLEEFSFKYVTLSEAELRAVAYGLIIVGAIIAGIVNKSKAQLTRAPYFAYSALLFLLVSAMEFIWLQSPPAMAGGYLWVLMVVNISARVVAGFYSGKLAMARSRDAYGHGRMAFLAFIPLANLWLLITPSKNAESVNRAPTITLITGGLGVLSGIVMLILGGAVTAVIEQEGNRLLKRAQTEPISQQAGIDMMVKSQGLEKTVRLLAANAQTPVTVDSVTTLARAEAAGTQLRRTYVVSRPLGTILDEVRTSITDGICAYGPFIPLLLAGGTIREVYIRRNGSLIGAVLITRDVCGI